MFFKKNKIVINMEKEKNNLWLPINLGKYLKLTIKLKTMIGKITMAFILKKNANNA